MTPEARQLLWIVVVAPLAFGVLAHAFFPRYEWRTVGDQGTTVVVYDRWSGRFQRGTYDDKGNVTPSTVYTPF
jgi:hypothetical protein